MSVRINNGCLFWPNLVDVAECVAEMNDNQVMSEQQELQERGVALATGVVTTDDAVAGKATVVPEEEEDQPMD